MIYSSPFPFDGKNLCPTVSNAEDIILSAFANDGKDILGTDFDSFVEWEDLPSLKEGEFLKFPARLKLGIGVGKIRKPIAALWGRMSKKAKASFFAKQYSAAVKYLDEVMDNIREEFGDDIQPKTPLPLPMFSELFGKKGLPQ